MPYQVAVIGGGAAGLCAAIAAAEAGSSVILCEKNARVGKKLLLTGNGRCNLSNLSAAPYAYNDPSFVSAVLSEYGCGEIRAFFESLGLWTYADELGRVYPVSETSSSVLDVLRLRCEALGVQTLCGREAVELRARKGGWQILFREGEELSARRVIVATGGGTKLLRNAGHAVTPFEPVLCPIGTDVSPIRGLSGLRVKCRAVLMEKDKKIAAERGEILFRDYGVSGIAAFDLSRSVCAGQTLSLDLMPDMSEGELRDKLDARNMPAGEVFTGIFHRRVGEAILRAAGSGAPEALARTIKNFTLSVTGKAETKLAQVTRGGAKNGEFDPKSMSSRLCPGLYAAGEALDVDARCGGFNLHWAFASGLTAGRSAACSK